jgi:hypothetical protein
MTDFKVRRLERPSAFSLWLNGLPLFHLASGLGVSAWLCDTASGRITLLAIWIYLLPPLASRLTILAWGRPEGKLTQDMSAYRVWWMLTQWQIIFNRLPWLEELLRLVPGLYALWIGLWGGSLSPYAYVGPRVLITDRYAIRVGRGAVLGMKSILAGHLVQRDEAGRWLVLAAAPIVEPEAILGGAARLGPGAVLRAGHMLPTGCRIHPFDEWPRRKDGARNTPDNAASELPSHSST